MRPLPPLAELRAFEAAARNLSFKAAAAELGVTPTAVSHRIRLLEQFCGTALFRRRPRPLALTPAGARLFPAVRDGLDGFVAALAGIRPAPARLRVTTTNAFASRWLVPRLPHWRAAHPEVRLELVGTDRVLDLAAGEADLLTFRDELHAIDAVLAGQGVAILDDAVIGDELASGALVPALGLPAEQALPDTGYYLVALPARGDDPAVRAFASWLRAMR